MAYIGTPVQQALTKVTSQSFNGTGSQTVFTLNRAVNTGEELEVFVNNVQQEPGVGKSYTATGTTLTFDAAPSSGTGNIYVIYRGLAEVTRRLEHDPNAALAATTGTFSGDLTVDTNTLYVDSTNNRIGVGTTSTPSTLISATSGGGIALDPNSFSAWNREATASNHSHLVFNQTGVDAQYLQFRKDGTTVGSIGTYSSRMYIGTGDVGLQFLDAADNILPINPSTPANRDGAIDLGAGTVRFKDLYLSGGVYLGGTGSANKLDDYEEGTWTPQITISSTNVTTTSTGAVYNKIGNFLYAHARVTFASGTLTGSVALTGLPFTSDDVYYCRGVSVNDYMDNPERYYVYVSGTTGTIRVGGNTQATGSRNLNGNDILDNSNLNFYFHIFYRTT